MIKNNN